MKSDRLSRSFLNKTTQILYTHVYVSRVFCQSLILSVPLSLFFSLPLSLFLSVSLSRSFSLFLSLSLALSFILNSPPLSICLSFSLYFSFFSICLPLPLSPVHSTPIYSPTVKRLLNRPNTLISPQAFPSILPHPTVIPHTLSFLTN